MSVVYALLALVALTVGHGLAWRRRHQALSTFVWLIALDAVVLLFVAVALIDRSLFEAWAQEDGWVEWSTCFAYLAAASLNVFSGVTRWRASRGGALWLFALAAFCVFVAGEELSWGQRLFAFKPPELFLKDNFQQELNLHNLLKNKSAAGLKLDSRYLVALVALGFGLGWPGLARLIARRRFGKAMLEATPPWALVGHFVAVAMVSLDYPINLAGEPAELCLGLCFAADAAIRWWPPPAVRIAQPLAAGALAPLLLGMVMPLLTERLLYVSDAEALEMTRHELSALAADVEKDSERLFERNVHKRLYTAWRDDYFSGPLLGFLEGQPSRHDRKGYYLDVWNNPYWVKSSTQTRTVWLYSFGPNRRRDSELEGAAVTFGGDDVGVALQR